MDQTTAPDEADTPELTLVTNGDADPDEPGDHVELVGNGWVRIRIGETRYRLRRPFFGELRTLRVALEALSDEITDQRIRAQQAAEDIQAQGEAAEADETLTPAKKAAELRRLHKRNVKVGRDLTTAGEDLRLDWWQKAFETLSVDGSPPDWPAWIIDARLPDKVLQHWRSAPLAHG